MALTLYYLSGSPYAWRVWLALEHKGIPYQLRSMSYDAGDFQKPEFAALNPRRRVPVIVEDDGFALYELAAIVEYLDEKSQGWGAAVLVGPAGAGGPAAHGARSRPVLRHEP